MLGLLCAVAGVIVGAAVTWALALRRSQALRDETAQARADLAVRDSQLFAANEMLVRERDQHDASIKNLGETFENLSNRVLTNTVERFSLSQEQVAELRASKLDDKLEPLEKLLDDYKQSLAKFNEDHVGALFDVKSRASELLEAQQKTQDETRRLNQLLGRGDQRGHWGEVQLVNVLEASGLRPTIDYEMQVSAVNDTGRALRPDCTVNMPNHARIAIDAKFPFDAFEASLATDDVELRRTKSLEHAAALRSHIKTLNEKSYWEVVGPAPEFVVCFVPSDYAITAAFDADPDLRDFAAKQRVLIVGPTNLLSLLWTVALVLRQHVSSLNAEKILKDAETMVDRIRLVAEPIAKMGKSLDDVVDSYNKMVKSVESRLIPAARNMSRLGGVHRAKQVPELASVEESVSSLNEDKWGVGPENELAEGVSEIIDLEDLDEE